MILVDTSIWIDHLHAEESHLVELLEADLVGVHPVVVEELALGSIAARDRTLELLGSLAVPPILSHAELLGFVTTNELWGRGLSAADAHMLGSTLLHGGASLWTRDKRLRSGAEDLGICHEV